MSTAAFAIVRGCPGLRLSGVIRHCCLVDRWAIRLPNRSKIALDPGSRRGDSNGLIGPSTGLRMGHDLVCVNRFQPAIAGNGHDHHRLPTGGKARKIGA